MNRDFLLSEQAQGPSMHSIIVEVCLQHNISHTDMVSERRFKALVRARHEAMYRCRMETKASLPKIARAFGKLDHACVMHAIKRHKQRMKAGKSGT